MFASAKESRAPELSVDEWFNTTDPPTLKTLRGRPVLIHAFQMLCPGCVAHTLPQMARVHDIFGKGDLAILGLHTVFEHHEAMTPTALEAFIHEYQLKIPIGVDARGEPGPIPQTMSAYQLRGTPSTILVDRGGDIVVNAFGHIDDLVLGAMIQSVLAEQGETPSVSDAQGSAADADPCDEEGCLVRPGTAR